MSRRAIKAINWAPLVEKVAEEEKYMLAAFRAHSDKIFRRMMANPETAPKIDWAYYKKNIPTAGLVDRFQKEYESLSIPYPTDKYTSQIEEREKEELREVEERVEVMKDAIEVAEEKIDTLKKMRDKSELTLAESGMHDLDNPTIFPHVNEFQPPQILEARASTKEEDELKQVVQEQLEVLNQRNMEWEKQWKKQWGKQN